MHTPTQTEKTLALLKSLETGDPSGLAHLHPDRYIQHNLAVPDGPGGLASLLVALPRGSVRVNTVRAFSDGPFTVTHTEYDFFGPKIGFDIFRFEDGLIVEHWDNLQATPSSLNPSGHSMTDGPIEAEDPEKTEENKAFVSRFLEQVLRGGDFGKLPAFISATEYTQHNPHIADGLSGLAAAVEAMKAQGIRMRYDRIHRVLGCGSFVLSVSEGEFAGKPVAFYDLFRVSQGLIVEHWDVIEPIPPRQEWKNDNGKF